MAARNIVGQWRSSSMTSLTRRFWFEDVDILPQAELWTCKGSVVLGTYRIHYNPIKGRCCSKYMSINLIGFD